MTAGSTEPKISLRSGFWKTRQIRLTATEMAVMINNTCLADSFAFSLFLCPIAILCDLNAAEASTMYEYGPDHPLCRKILKKKVRKPSIKKLKETEQAAAMKALLDQGYSQDAVSEAFQCFPSTVRRRVRKFTERKETNDRSEIDCRNI